MGVPGSIDEAVRAAAHRQLGAGARWRIGARAGAALATAASLLLVTAAWLFWPSQGGAPTVSRTVVVDDANADGVVDILDALAIAREDRAAGAALASRLVRLHGGPG